MYIVSTHIIGVGVSKYITQFSILVRTHIYSYYPVFRVCFILLNLVHVENFSFSYYIIHAEISQCKHHIFHGIIRQARIENNKIVEQFDHVKQASFLT